MDDTRERYMRAEGEYRAQLSRRPGQNQARLDEIAKDKRGLEELKASWNDHCNEKQQMTAKQIRVGEERERRALEEKHARQLADLLKAQEAEKESEARRFRSKFELAEKNRQSLKADFPLNIREKEERFTEQWAEQKRQLTSTWTEQDHVFNDMRRAVQGRDTLNEVQPDGDARMTDGPARKRRARADKREFRQRGKRSRRSRSASPSRNGDRQRHSRDNYRDREERPRYRSPGRADTYRPRSRSRNTHRRRSRSPTNAPPHL